MEKKSSPLPECSICCKTIEDEDYQFMVVDNGDYHTFCLSKDQEHLTRMSNLRDMNDHDKHFFREYQHTQVGCKELLSTALLPGPELLHLYRNHDHP